MQVKLDLYFEEKQFDVLLLTKLSSAKTSFVQQSVLLRRHINFKMLDLDAYDFLSRLLKFTKNLVWKFFVDLSRFSCLYRQVSHVLKCSLTYLTKIKLFLNFILLKKIGLVYSKNIFPCIPDFQISVSDGRNHSYLCGKFQTDCYTVHNAILTNLEYSKE